MKNDLAVRIFNLSEDVWPFIEAMGQKKRRKAEIEENANLSDRDLFSMAEECEFVFITPKIVDSDFVDYFIKLCAIKELTILVPEKHSGRLCEDVLSDKKIMKQLMKSGKDKRLKITSYSTTPSFLKLVKTLREKGLEVKTPAAPEEHNAWTVNFYGSKSGIRQLTQINGAIRADLKMPTGVVSSGIVDTARIAANKYIREGGVVIKTNKGHSGAGVLIFRKGDLPKKFNDCEKELIGILKRDLYWERFPIVIESLVRPNPRIGGGFPDAEFLVKKNGEVKFLYYCGMRVDKDGVFAGVEIGEEVLPKRVAAKITDIGYLIGEQYAKDGYCGFYDVDFIAEHGGEVYLSESNVRVTGGTHVYQTAMELVGRNFMKHNHVISDNLYPIPSKRKFRFKLLLERLEPLLFSKKTKEGVVVTSASLLDKGFLAYIIFGKTARRARKIEKEMQKMLF